MDVTKIEDRKNSRFNTIVVRGGELSRGTQVINTDFIMSPINPGFVNLEKRDLRIIEGLRLQKELPGLRPLILDDNAYFQIGSDYFNSPEHIGSSPNLSRISKTLSVDAEIIFTACNLGG